jgi:hypothetical protein
MNPVIGFAGIVTAAIWGWIILHTVLENTLFGDRIVSWYWSRRRH